jgi:C-3',4' desaturase CrtD
MNSEVVVVGGGIGGLTVAALLAQRGVAVCLLERESSVGGCAASFDKFGYSFEQGYGLYPLWRPGEIHDRIFSELPVEPPEVRLLEPGYVVRLPDESDVVMTANTSEFEENLRKSFPECADKAIDFYRASHRISKQLLRALRRIPDFPTAGTLKQIYSLMPNALEATRVIKSRRDTALQHLGGTSLRFRRFIDVQLQTLAGSSAEDCAYLYSCVALNVPLEGSFSIQGGSAALADALSKSIIKSGGTIRLNAPVLRLALDAGGTAIGVDLLIGETIHASRAVISNMTVWDTYGKLVGLTRTPTGIRKRLASLQGWGAYLLYLGMDEAVAQRLPAEHILTLTDWQEGQAYDPEHSQFTFAAAPKWDSRAPAGKRAVTVHAFTDVDDWFAFHKDESDLEVKDQAMLELFWQRLHKALPELGADVEVIETATPRTFYDVTRRKLGMVGGLGQALSVFGPNAISHRTAIPNLFLVGDTTFPGAGLAAVSHSALNLANEITS